MSEREKPEVIVSPRGVITQAFLNRPSTEYNKHGVYSCKVEFAKKEIQPVIDQIEEIIEAQYKALKKSVLAEAKKKGTKPKRPKKADPSYEESADGKSVIVNFKKYAGGVRKDKTEWTATLALFDAHNNPIDPDTCNIGHGTEVKVSFFLNGFGNSGIGAGCSIKMKAVKVYKMVEYTGASAEDQGFEDDADDEDFSVDDLKDRKPASKDDDDGDWDDDDDDDDEAEEAEEDGDDDDAEGDDDDDDDEF